MFRKSKVGTAVAVLVGGSLFATAMPLLAQSGERVEITGSRIRSIAAESPSPVQIIGSAEIEASGAVNLQELLLKNPTFGTPAISRTNSNFSTASAGVATVDLRNLGTARTLVLVNGRRFVSGVPGSSAVDFNSIPTDFIERIEILTGGASSTYGSDAVAGVVNVILKRGFTGLSLDASIGQSAEGDDDKRKFSITFGSNSENGRGNVMGHLAYSKQGAVFSRDRERSAVDQASTGAFVTGDGDQFFEVTRPFFSSFTPQGRIFYSIPNPAFDPGLPVGPSNQRLLARNGTFQPDGTFGPYVGSRDGFNRSAFRTIAIPTERFLFAGKGEYNLTDNATTWFEGTYASTQTKTDLEPFPLDSSGSTGIYPASAGRIPVDFMVGGVLLTNPTVPSAVLSLLTDRDGDGARDYNFTRRLSEVGNRGNVADRDTFRIATGVKGTIANAWDYDAYIAYGATKESQVGGGQVNVLNFRNALEAIPDVDDVNGNGSTTDAICRDAQARAQGCVPISIFGLGAISPAAAKYIDAPSLLATFTSQRLFGGTISGQPLRLPAGPLGVAVGAEHREEFSRSEFDSLQQAGLNAGNAIPRTEGKFSVTEYFAEARVPLLKDLPGIKALALNAAVRSGDYSTVGSTVSWNAGLEWSPVSDVKVRVTSSVSTRAPNINELFSPPSQTFPTGLSDPCDGVTATSTEPQAARCRAEPGVAANIAANGAFTLVQADLQGISGFDRGNPDLLDEKGKSLTVGLTFTPRAINGLALTVDYFRIEIDDAIVSTPRQFILNQCYAGGNEALCGFITRRVEQEGASSPGSLDLIDSAVTNSGGLYTEGVDLTVSYATTLGPGRFAGRLAYTNVIKGYTVPLPGSDQDPFAGEVGASKHKASLSLSYNVGPFGIASQTTYIGKASLDNTFLADYGYEAGAYGVGAKVYNDFQFTYTYKKAQFYLGIDNAFDTKPPMLITGLPGNVTGAETDASTYDAIGRRYYLGVRMAF
jgi:iron complex outermembrane recepter protein